MEGVGRDLASARNPRRGDSAGCCRGRAVNSMDQLLAHGRSKSGHRWTHDSVAYALDRFHRRHLRTPTQREIGQGVEELPSLSTIKRLYGTTGQMLRYHGYRVRPRGG